MDKIVQAKCPFCQHVLRIPAEWLDRPMRCKRCQKVFQAKGKPASVPAAVGLSPAAQIISASLPNSRKPRRPSSRLVRTLVGVGLGLGITCVCAAALIVASPFLLQLAKGLGTPDDRKEVVVGQLDPKKEEKKLPADNIKKDGPSTKKEDKGEPKIGAKKEEAKKNFETKIDPPKEKKAEPKDKKVDTKIEDKKVDTKIEKKEPKVEPKDQKAKTKKGSDPPAKVVAKGLMPRRALAVSVNDYLLANPLNYGKGREGIFSGANTNSVLYWLGQSRLKFPNTQLTELSDYSAEGEAPLKQVIETTIADFAKTSRPQDRIVLLFSGHIVESEESGDAFLVPLEGDLEDTKTLIPLAWVYEQLKNCPARQKVLVLDVCRYDPGRGNERSGGDPMGEFLEKKLKNPPPGVQVWASCSKEQQSYEFENGGLFLEAVCTVLWKKLDTMQEPEDSIPLAQLCERVNEYLAERLKGTEWKQQSFVAGEEPKSGAPYDPNEPMPAKLVIQSPKLDGGVAGMGVVKSILDEINSAPPARANRGPSYGKLRFAALPPFPARVLDEYKMDAYGDEMEFLKKKDEFPLRHVIVKTKLVLRENANAFQMKEYFDGNNIAATKKLILGELEKPGKAIFSLEEALDEMVAAEKFLKDEPSKRWKAHYDYTMARLKSRLLYVLEYSEVLAKIRTDSLPPLDKGTTGYRIASVAKLTSREGKSRAWRSELKSLWNKIVDEYPQTPWALMARRERGTALGLEWRAARK